MTLRKLDRFLDNYSVEELNENGIYKCDNCVYSGIGKFCCRDPWTEDLVLCENYYPKEK